MRQPRDADAAAIFKAYTQDPVVAQYLVWRPHQRLAETEAFIAYCMDCWANERSRPFVMTLIENDDLPIGMIEARMLSHGIDLGYVLQQSSWGTGLMTEATAALTETALAIPACFRVQATCDTENHGSAQVLKKAGFNLEGRLERHTILPNLGPEPRASLMFARCK